jgi:NAD+ kinase
MTERKLKFALFGNVYQARKCASAQKLLSILVEKNAEIAIEHDFYLFLTKGLRLDVHPTEIIENDQFTADFAISMGGDGTFLKAASHVGDKNIPILGINMGRLGFLADISADEIENIIDALYEEHYTVEERSVLQIESDNDSIKGYPFALNEVAILKKDDSSMITIHTSINGEYLTIYQADGLLLSTPTGSTGYSLSVGAPIMVPQSKSFILTAVAPHSLNIRPVVVNDDATIQFTVESRSHNFLIAVDGRSETCKEGTSLTIRKAPYTIKVVKRFNQSFFNTLRHKLMWGADNRQ